MSISIFSAPFMTPSHSPCRGRFGGASSPYRGSSSHSEAAKPSERGSWWGPYIDRYPYLYILLAP